MPRQMPAFLMRLNSHSSMAIKMHLSTRRIRYAPPAYALVYMLGHLKCKPSNRQIPSLSPSYASFDHQDINTVFPSVSSLAHIAVPVGAAEGGGPSTCTDWAEGMNGGGGGIDARSAERLEGARLSDGERKIAGIT